ncbi:hypothetical protein [Brevundimonas naejangsanensis]
MLKQLVIAATMAGSMMVGIPEAKASDPTACLLNNGCHFDSDKLMWICGNPRIYMLCVEP